LTQLANSIEQTIDSQQTFEVYAVVQVGLEIGFFELHSDRSNLDEEEIPHFRGCIFLTQHYWIGNEENVIMEDLHDDVDKLYFNAESLKINPEMRREAEEYPIPCIFDIEKCYNVLSAPLKEATGLGLLTIAGARLCFGLS
jgi:hypothetical protein